MAKEPKISGGESASEIESLRAQLAAMERDKAAAQALIEEKDSQLQQVKAESDHAWTIAREFQGQATDLEDQVQELKTKATTAAANPVLRTNRHEALEQFGIGDARFSDHHNNPIDMIVPQLVMDGEAAIKHEEELRFMAEPVVIQFATTHERNAQQIFKLGHQGRPYVFERGKTYRVARFIVSQLLDLMTESFGNTEYVDTDGVKKVKYPGTAGLRFPFSVIQDSQQGLHWFSRRNQGYSRDVHL